MLEIFIPTEIFEILSIHVVNSRLLSLIKDHFSVIITPFESSFFRGYHIRTTSEFQDIITLCNWQFGTGYFIDYDWQNTKITTLWKRFFKPDSIGQELTTISTDFESIVQTLNSENLLTNTKKEESIKKIKNWFFLLSGVVFNLVELRRKVQDNIHELEVIIKDPEQKIEYHSHGELLVEPLRTKEIELTASIETLEQKVALFIDATKHYITK